MRTERKRAVSNFYLENAKLLSTMKPMVSNHEMIDNISMDIQPGGILNGGSEGVKISERFSNDQVRITQLVFNMQAFVPKHHHPHWCVIKVLSGVIVDSENGEVLEKGEMFLYKPGQFHNAIATQISEVLVFNTINEVVAKDILEKGDYHFRGKKAQYQLISIDVMLRGMKAAV